VVAERDRIGAGIDQVAVDRLGDTEAAGRILAIDADEIELPLLDQARQALQDDRPPAAADDVTDEQDAHRLKLPGRESSRAR
jgi:hypothetical protein